MYKQYEKEKIEGGNRRKKQKRKKQKKKNNVFKNTFNGNMSSQFFTFALLITLSFDCGLLVQNPKLSVVGFKAQQHILCLCYSFTLWHV